MNMLIKLIKKIQPCQYRHLCLKLAQSDYMRNYYKSCTKEDEEGICQRAKQYARDTIDLTEEMLIEDTGLTDRINKLKEVKNE